MRTYQLRDRNPGSEYAKSEYEIVMVDPELGEEIIGWYAPWNDSIRFHHAAIKVSELVVVIGECLRHLESNR